MATRLLEGKTALVTAGTSGLGRAFVRAFAHHGAAVGIHYRSDRETAYALTEEITSIGGAAVPVHADLREPDEVNAMVADVRSALGGVNVLVNNASIYLDAQPVETLPWENVQAEVEGSLKTAFLTTQATLPGMLEDGRGTIILLIGTMLQRPAQGYAAHAAGKGAMQAWGKTMAKELAPRGISVHFLSPGMALTPNVLETVPEVDRERLRKKTPTRHLQPPEELASLAVFLASDLTVATTALHLNADGGLAELG